MYLGHLSHRELHRLLGRRDPWRPSRRDVLKAGSAAAALAALWPARTATAAPLGSGRAIATPPVGGAPNPIPGGVQIGPFGFFHIFLPTDTLFPNPDIESGEGDPSTITDFNGHIGVFEPFGGTGLDNNGVQQFWAADVRFLDGEYVDVFGRHRQGSFAFV